MIPIPPLDGSRLVTGVLPQAWAVLYNRLERYGILIVITLIYLGILLAVVTAQVFRDGPVTAHRIRGAIVIYLLLGVMWAFTYQVVALNIPQAFRLPEGVIAGDPDALRRELTYFSFVTLTTTGYGDITAVHPVARTLVMLEALVGQLYPAIVLAWLVSMAIMHQKEKP